MSPALLLILTTFAAPVETPRVLDDRLQLELVLQEPEIVTPTGLTIDAKGRVLVVESHTHFRPDGYKGPPHDRILLIDPQEKPAKPSVFFEGTKFTMNLAKAPDGSIYVATRSEIFRLRDLDGDDKADKPEERTPIAHLETAGNYPHNGLSGFAFRPADGKSFEVTFGFGENLGADYKLVGSDGASLAGGGEGGNIYACKPDGSKLRRVATGFWNPFHMTFDAQGRLFAVDNDPDSRPPCRLLHIVEGGDYGYRFRNGRKGTHPFTAWNGELPGTLPMVAGTGEAPCAVISYDNRGESAPALPDDYQGSLLVTSWGENRIERFDLLPYGASYRAKMTPVVVGDHTFRPVGMAVAPDGSIYFSDWVDRSYPLHGKGRVWRLGAKSAVSGQEKRDASKALDRSAGGDFALRFADVVRAWSAKELARGVGELAAYDAGDALPFWAQQLADETFKSRPDVLEKLATDADFRRTFLEGLRTSAGESYVAHDPFLWQAASMAVRNSLQGKPLDDPSAAAFVRRYVELKNPQALVWAAIGARDADPANARLLAPLLLKQESSIARVLGVLWIGELRLVAHKAALEKTLAEPNANYQLTAVCFAALDALEAEQPTRDGGKSPVGERLAVALLHNPRASTAARRYALKLLPPDHPESATVKLKFLLDDPDKAVAVEAVRTMRERRDAQADLLWLLDGHASSADLHSEAIAGLSPDVPESRAKLVELAAGDDLSDRAEALRVLRTTDAAGSAATSPQSAQAADLRISELDREPDPAAGERLFFHPRVASCSRCHEYEGRGAAIGPALTTFGQGASRLRILQSILDPSREIAPHYVPWIVTTVDGRTFTGLYVREDGDGTQHYVDGNGVTIKIASREIESREAAKQSIMPADFGRTLTDAELRDLAAFLMRPAE